jgi:L-lactate dehydrogenase complex protein LldG
MTGDSNGGAGARAQVPAPREQVLSPREQVLSKIGAPAHHGAELAQAYSRIHREYKQEGSLDLTARLEMLEHRLREYDALVYRSTPENLAPTIVRILKGRGKLRIAIPRGLPSTWLSPCFSFLMGEDLPVQELDHMDGLLSGCTVAISTTGTLVLQNAPAQGARRLSLVPDYHLCVVNADQVVETVPEAMAILEPTSRRPTTFISGPSATADIEMTRIKGVHGPRFLDVILVL